MFRNRARIKQMLKFAKCCRADAQTSLEFRLVVDHRYKIWWNPTIKADTNLVASEKIKNQFERGSDYALANKHIGGNNVDDGGVDQLHQYCGAGC